ncbi:hypothetical protein, partial [Actinomadura roseirufa]|uniref:hypothetical protein n=1 Tax=Actinomadura roseirufa TaxID=2094049 RepID=UPI0010414956
MESAPIHGGAQCPRDRYRHALLTLLARLAAVAGLAFAGWLVLSALGETAFASQRDGAGQRGPAAAAPSLAAASTG